MSSEKGSLTVEAVIAFPLFLCFFFLLLFLVRVACLNLLLDQAVHETVKRLAASAYPLSFLYERENELSNSDENLSFTAVNMQLDPGNVLPVLDSGLKGMLVSLAELNQGKYGLVKGLLSEHLKDATLKVEDLVLNIVQLPRGPEEDVVLQVAYTLHVPFPFFRDKEFALVHTAVEKAWFKGSNGVFTKREERNIFNYEEEPRIVYVTKTGECYHLKDCFAIRGKKKIPMEWSEARKKYRGCKHCVPL